MGARGPFDDIIDGYFPLQLSIAFLMRRHGMQQAMLEFSFAPIIAVDGLPHDAPVPLNIRSGRAGMIDHAALWVEITDQSAKLTGTARWRWLDGAQRGAELDPMIRLAEPAVVRVEAVGGMAARFAGMVGIVSVV